ncbi:MAG: hypothetical protein ACJ78V_00590 [Myxococcales bacterium]
MTRASAVRIPNGGAAHAPVRSAFEDRRTRRARHLTGLDRNGQLFFDIFDTDGFLGDVMVVNGAYKPFFEVERRKYRFRLLNGGPARFYKFALSDSSPFQQIANDGNLMARPIQLTQTDELGVAERYDIVVDFSRWSTCSRPAARRAIPSATAPRWAPTSAA